MAKWRNVRLECIAVELPRMKRKFTAANRDERRNEEGAAGWLTLLM